jgi:hypothetical protein
MTFFGVNSNTKIWQKQNTACQTHFYPSHLILRFAHKQINFLPFLTIICPNFFWKKFLNAIIIHHTSTFIFIPFQFHVKKKLPHPEEYRSSHFHLYYTTITALLFFLWPKAVVFECKLLHLIWN